MVPVNKLELFPLLLGEQSIELVRYKPRGFVGMMWDSIQKSQSSSQQDCHGSAGGLLLRLGPVRLKLRAPGRTQAEMRASAQRFQKALLKE